MFELKVGHGNRMHVIGMGGGGGDDEELGRSWVKGADLVRKPRGQIFWLFVRICSANLFLPRSRVIPLPRATQFGLGQRKTHQYKSTVGFWNGAAQGNLPLLAS